MGVWAVGLYIESGPNRATHSAVNHTEDGSPPPPNVLFGSTIATPISSSGIEFMEIYLTNPADAAPVKARFQMLRSVGFDKFWSENSVVKSMTMDSTGPTGPVGGERWRSDLPEEF